VRAAAIRILGGRREREAVDRLIEQLDREDGRLRADAADALGDLTGRRLGYAAGPWRAWWQPRRETFDAARPADDRGGDVDTAGFYGVPLLSKRIIFCLDVSSSMIQAAAGGGSRLDRAKRELSRVLSALPGDAYVNLLFFDDTVESWRGGLVPLRDHRASALQAVSRLNPRGSTDLCGTVERAFEDPAVDTIFLLSDGRPNAGPGVTTGAILDRVHILNRTRRVALHAIALEKSELLKALAEQNGGRYVEKP
jgi:hypothetical protein